jgi:hypothetical protein
MSLTPIYYIFSRKETKVFVICTVTGGLLQFFCRRYIKNHPEFLEEPEITIEIKNPSGKTVQITNEIAEELAKEPIIRRIIKHLRGGQFQEKPVEILLRVMLKKFIKFAAKKAVEISIYIGAGLAFSVTPKKALAKIIEGSLPQNLLDTKSFIQVNGEKVYLENCDNSFKYMFSILMEKELPYNEKKELVTYVFRVHLDGIKPRNLILCLIPILLILAIQNLACYYLVIKNLIQAIKEGRISKRIARIIVRRLLKKGRMVDPELLDLIEN